MSVRFTPAQAIDLAEISAETLRYWKKFMPSLASKRGHAPCYTRAEIVALIVVRRLVRDDFKMDVSALATHSETLFTICAAQWALPNRRLLRVSCDGNVSVHESLAGVEFSDAAIVFPLDAAIAELDQRLNEQEGLPQMELGLPPVPVDTKPRRAS